MKNQEKSVNIIINERIDQYDKNLPITIKGKSNCRGEAFQLFAVKTIKNIAPNNIFKEDRIDKQGREYLIDFFFLNKDFSEIDIICAQTGNYSERILSDFKIGFNKIFLEHTKLTNANLESKRKKIWKNKEAIEIINIFFCTINLSKELKDYFEKLETELESIVNKDYPKTKINIFPLDGSGLMVYEKKLLSKAIGQYDLNIKDNKGGLIQNRFDGEIEKVNVALVEIRDLLKIYKEKGDLIFYLNIREDLGKNRVNNGMLKDINNSRLDYFWCLNNGLTIVCDKFNKKTTGSAYSILNPIIINGQQTLRTLNSCQNKIKDDHYILCKIITTSDINFIEKITETSNSQTHIEYRDLKSNHTLLIVMEELFKLNNLFLKRKKGKRGKSLPFSYSSKIVAQCVMSVLMSRPNIGRLGKDKVLFDEHFDEIFNKDYKEIILSVLIYDKVRECIKNMPKNLKNNVNQFIWHIVAQIGKDEILKNKKNVNKDEKIEEYRHKKFTNNQIEKNYQLMYEGIPAKIKKDRKLSTYLNTEESLKLIK